MSRPTLMGAGAWLAWLAYDRGTDQHDGVPSRRFLRWNTRTVRKEQVHYWERGINRRNMRLYRHEELWLFRLDVTPFVGEPYTLWEIDHDFVRGTALYDTEKPDAEGVRRMGRSDFYSDAGRALAVFRAIAQGPGGYVRGALPGEPPLPGGAWFRITEEHPHVLYADDWRDPLDVIDLTGGRDVHEAIEEWIAGRLAAGLPRTADEADR